jgi:hypothetical protein
VYRIRTAAAGGESGRKGNASRVQRLPRLFQPRRIGRGQLSEELAVAARSVEVFSAGPFAAPSYPFQRNGLECRARCACIAELFAGMQQQDGQH